MAFSHWEILIMWLFLFPLTLHWTQKDIFESRFIMWLMAILVLIGIVFMII